MKFPNVLGRVKKQVLAPRTAAMEAISAVAQHAVKLGSLPRGEPDEVGQSPMSLKQPDLASLCAANVRSVSQMHRGAPPVTHAPPPRRV